MMPVNDNPTEVLLALDRELDHEIALVLYGRAALCLGFANPAVEFATTQDVDGWNRNAKSKSLATKPIGIHSCFSVSVFR
jgi:hypothetical protein